MLFPRLAPICILPALLSAAPLAAQDPACAAGPADEAGMRIAFTLPGTPERAAERVALAVQAQEYAIAQSSGGARSSAAQLPRGAGPWAAAPRRAWLPYQPDMPWNEPAHPGVQLSGDIQPKGDSSEVTLFARTLCGLGSAGDAGPLGRAEDLVEQFSGLFLMYAVVEGGERDHRVGVFSLDLPSQLGDLRRIGQRSVPPRAIQLAYEGGDSLAVDAYLYLGPVPFVRCTPSCAEVLVRREVSGYLRLLPQSMARFGGTGVQLRSAESLAPGAGDGWQAGLHLAHHVAREDGDLATHYYVYAFPDFLLKFRSTFPDSPARAERLRAFVAAALAAVIRTEGGPPPPALPRPGR